MNDFTWAQAISEYFQGELTFCENNSGIIHMDILWFYMGILGWP